MAVQAVSDDTMRTDLTVDYDGGCPLCRGDIGQHRICRGAERVAFVDVGGTAPSVKFGPGRNRTSALRRFHVRDGGGRLASGVAAFVRLWRVLPAWRWLERLVGLRVFGKRPLLPLAELVYRISLPFRLRLARLIARQRH